MKIWDIHRQQPATDAPGQHFELCARARTWYNIRAKHDNMTTAARVLVVDDDPAVLGVFSDMLRSQGYEVWEAATGREGLRMALEKQPYLVLLDVMLPDMTGFDVCRKIKTDPTLPDVFVILVTGQGTDTDSKVEGLESGADDYVVKPVDRA